MLVELALAVLPISMLAFGSVDLGRGYTLQTHLRNAARAAAGFVRSLPTQVAPTPDPSGAGTCANPNNAQYQAANEEGPTGSEVLPPGAVVTITDVTRGFTITGCGPDYASPPVVGPGDVLQVDVSAPFTLISPLIGAAVGSVTVHGTVQVVAQ